MDLIISWAISATVAMTLLSFVVYLVGLRRLPIQHRPKTPTYNRFGQIIGETENPDFHVNPGEDPKVELEARLADIERQDTDQSSR